MKKILAITAVSAVALFMGAQTAAAWWPCCYGDNVVVTNHNTAAVLNGVSAYADTGDNTADGGDATDAGNGGSVNCSGNRNTGGDGGNGGDAGDGGVIRTGAAYADALVSNTVNTNDTKIVDDCCDDCDRTVVRNYNDAMVGNLVEAGAFTGYNNTDGGDAGGAGAGGSVNCSGDCNTGGDGGNGGDGGDGGEVYTGPATSYATSINVVNSNITRIRR